MDVVDVGAKCLCPRNKLLTHILRTGVAANRLWLAPPFNEVLGLFTDWAFVPLNPQIELSDRKMRWTRL